MENQNLTRTPPIAWPEVQVDGETYTLKYSLAVNYKAAKAGIDLRGLADPIRTFAAGMDVFALMVAPQLEAMGKPVLSGLEWSEKLTGLEQFTEITQAVARAYTLSKVMPTESSPAPNTTADTGKRPN